jgi:hypothetical protein
MEHGKKRQEGRFGYGVSWIMTKGPSPRHARASLFHTLTS